MVMKVGTVRVEERGRIVIPKDIRDKLRLRPGTILEVNEKNGIIVMRPKKDFELFKKELKGCVKHSVIHPLEVKNIWQERE